MAAERVIQHLFSGFVRMHILYHAAKESVYGAELAEELTRHGYRIGPGTLYPTLHFLEQSGYLRSRAETVDGRRRKYYRATPSGKRVLAAAKAKLVELVAEVIEDNDQPFRELRQKRRQR